MQRPRFEIGIYQIVDDAMMKANRSDGTGWEWGWADWRRDWMDATPNRYAYRCLPLTIMNQTGWWVKNPVGFTATWQGRTEPGSMDFAFDTSGDLWKGWINNQFGAGIITWNTPFLFRTKPEGSRLLVLGPANHFKANAHPLSALIESDWISMSFTMNWKLMTPGEPVRFEPGEPLFQVVPLISNACSDLESAEVTYQKLSDDPEIHRSYQEWNTGRLRFHKQKARGEVKPDDWQKDYFQGRDVSGREVAPDHMTKVKPPQIHYVGVPPVSQPKDSVNPTPRSSPSSISSSSSETSRARKDPGSAAGRDDPWVTQVEVTTAGVVAEGPKAATAAVVPSKPGKPFDDDWRRWIAENLMVGGLRENLIPILVGSGFALQEATREVDRAMQSPYLKAAERLSNRLRKREWQLATYRKLQRLHPRSGEVERKHKLSRADFLADHYSANRPVIITGMMDDWPALAKWSLDYFSERFGDREVEVQFGRNAATVNYEAEREKFVRTLRFGEFIEKVRNEGVTNDFYMTANNNSNNKTVLAGLWDDVVQVPEYLDGRDPLGGFFWLGPAGTITPFHHDLTNNAMAQVIGRKRVKIAPSWDLPLMANHFHVFSNVDGRVTPASPHPSLDQPQILECILHPGEILFLPVGCLHFVEGIDISATVSFTNFVFDNDFASFYTTYHGV